MVINVTCCCYFVLFATNSELTLEVQLPAFSISCWVSHSRMIGCKISADSLIIRSKLNHSLSPATDRLIHRPISSWSVQKFRSELRNCLINLCSSTADGMMFGTTPSGPQRSDSRTTNLSAGSSSAASDRQDGGSNATRLSVGLASVKEQEEEEGEGDTVSVRSDTNTILSAPRSEQIRETELINVEKVTYSRTDDRLLHSSDNSADAKVSGVTGWHRRYSK